MSSEHPAATVEWPRRVALIRRVLLGQWADNSKRLDALKALKELEREVIDLTRRAAS